MINSEQCQTFFNPSFKKVFCAILILRLLAYVWQSLAPYLALTMGLPAIPALIVIFSMVGSSLVCWPEIDMLPPGHTIAHHTLSMLLITLGSIIWTLVVRGLIWLWWKFCY